MGWREFLGQDNSRSVTVSVALLRVGRPRFLDSATHLSETVVRLLTNTGAPEIDVVCHATVHDQ